MKRLRIDTEVTGFVTLGSLYRCRPPHWRCLVPRSYRTGATGQQRHSPGSARRLTRRDDEARSRGARAPCRASPASRRARACGAGRPGSREIPRGRPPWMSLDVIRPGARSTNAVARGDPGERTRHHADSSSPRPRDLRLRAPVADTRLQQCNQPSAIYCDRLSASSTILQCSNIRAQTRNDQIR